MQKILIIILLLTMTCLQIHHSGMDSGTSATNNLYVHRDCASLKNILVQLIDCHDVHYSSVCLKI